MYPNAITQGEPDSFCQTPKGIRLESDGAGAVMGSSRLAGVYELSMPERRRRAAEAAGLAPESLSALTGEGGLQPEQADHMIENVIGVYGLRVGVAAPFQRNGTDVRIPTVL